MGRPRKPHWALAKRLELAKARVERGKVALEHETKMVLEPIKANLEADQNLVAQLEEAIAKQKAGTVSSSDSKAQKGEQVDGTRVAGWGGDSTPVKQMTGTGRLARYRLQRRTAGNRHPAHGRR